MDKINKIIFLVFTMLSFSIFSMEHKPNLCGREPERTDGSRIPIFQNQNDNSQVLDSGISDDPMDTENSREDSGSSVGSKRKRGEIERELDSADADNIADCKHLEKKRKIEIGDFQENSIDELFEGEPTVDSLRKLAAKKIADYLADPKVFPNFKFNPQELNEQTEDLVADALYKYHSNKVWSVKEENIGLIKIPLFKYEYSTISNDERIFIMYDRKDAKVCDINSGNCFWCLRADENDLLLSAQISHNSKFIITSYISRKLDRISGKVKIWDIQSRNCIRVLENINENNRNELFSLWLSENNQLIVISSEKHISVWDLKKDKIIYSLDLNEDCYIGAIGGLDISKDCSLLLLMKNRDSDFKPVGILVDLTSGKILHEYKMQGSAAPHKHPVYNLVWKFSPKCNYVTVEYFKCNLRDRAVEVFDAVSGKNLYSVDCNSMHVTSDDKYLITYDPAGSLQIRDIKTGACLKSLDIRLGHMNKIIKFGNNKIIIENPHNVIICDIQGNVLKNIKGINPGPRISSDEKLLVMQSQEDKLVQIWDLESLQPLQIITNSEQESYPRLFKSQNNKFVIQRNKNMLYIWKINLNSRELINRLFNQI